MGLFDTKEGCDQYEKMSEGFDGRDLITTMEDFVDPGARVLELGMGPGKDLDMLRARYEATGSDASAVFVDRYNRRVSDGGAIVLDAITLETDERFDAIYSNKVLHHLPRTDLPRSLKRQAEVVSAGGILFHSFWLGDKTEEHAGLLFNYYTLEILTALLPDVLEVIYSSVYAEFEENDSLLLVLRVK